PGGPGTSATAPTAFPTPTPAATNPGTPRPSLLKYPPIDGPSITPSPATAPIQPSPRARSSAVVVSATYACASVTVPPAAPAAMRDAKSSQSDVASPKIR